MVKWHMRSRKRTRGFIDAGLAQTFIAGTTIQSGMLVTIKDDGRVYPAFIKPLTRLQKVRNFFRRALNQVEERPYISPLLGMALHEGRVDMPVEVGVQGEVGVKGEVKVWNQSKGGR